jgi:phosphate transport system protein
METTTRHFQSRLDSLAEKLSELGTLTEQAIEGSIVALVERDSKMARMVIEGDARIDALELVIDGMCVDLLALEQPLAKDFRFITTAMKVTPDLERIADHAVNISERALELNEEPVWPLGEIPQMAQTAREMVHTALEALMHRDGIMAREAIRRDDELDHSIVRTFKHLMRMMIDHPEGISRAMRLSFVAKYLERIGDQATNICQQVVFMVEAEVIKHDSEGSG